MSSSSSTSSSSKTTIISSLSSFSSASSSSSKFNYFETNEFSIKNDKDENDKKDDIDKSNNIDDEKKYYLTDEEDNISNNDEEEGEEDTIRFSFKNFDRISNDYKLIMNVLNTNYSEIWIVYKLSTQEFYFIKILMKSEEIKSDDIYVIYEMLFLKSIETKIKNNNNNINFTIPNIPILINRFEFYYDNFLYDGLIFPFNGFSINTNYYFNKLIQPLEIRNLIRDISKGLFFLHEECNIIHGNLKLENIIIDDNNKYNILYDILKKYFLKNNLESKIFYDIIKKKEIEDKIRFINNKNYTYYIHNFENAIFSNINNKIIEKNINKAPELFINNILIGKKSDIWDLGFLIFEYLCKKSIMSFTKDYFSEYSLNDENYLCKLLYIFGPFVKNEYIFISKIKKNIPTNQWNKINENFNSLENRFTKILRHYIRHWPESDINGFINLMKNILKICPEDRFDTYKIINDNWILGVDNIK